MAPFTSRLTTLRRRCYQAVGRRYLAHVRALTPLRAFVAARDKDAHAPDYADLAYLYRQVVRRQPRVVLEYGSGCSTLILALALQHTGQPVWFVSLETDPAWAAATRQALPMPFRDWCCVRTSPLVQASHGDVHGFAYAVHPADLVPDLIYLDGPGFTAAHAALRHLYAVDLLRLEPLLWRGCRLIVDGRKAQTAFLRQHFQRRWRFRRDHVMDRHVFTLDKEE